MAAKKKTTRKAVQKFPRQLTPEELDVRDFSWAVGIKCPCGRELDFFNRYQPHEMVCLNCGRHYSVEIVGYEVKG